VQAAIASKHREGAFDFIGSGRTCALAIPASLEHATYGLGNRRNTQRNKTLAAECCICVAFATAWQTTGHTRE